MNRQFFDKTNMVKGVCENSKIGSHNCSVGTPYGWSCDFCLYEELDWLNKNGVETTNSCCGHTDSNLAFILVYGEKSADFMRSHGYERVYRANNSNLERNGMTEWIPKTIFPYCDKEGVL